MMTLERYSHVMHMTSQVSGRLRDGKSAIDVLRATLPAGTVSGAPKVRAMEIIDDLEPTKRGPYAGVVGYLDFSGNIDTAIAIRTLVVGDDGRASVQAGAGHRRRQRGRARGPRVPQQGPGPPRGHPGRSPHDGAAPRPRRGTRHPCWVAFRSWGHPSTSAPPWVPCPSRATSSAVEGPEATDFLQGQLSQDVAALAVGDVGPVAPPPADREGRRLAAGHPDRTTTRFLLDVDAGLR